MEKYAEIVRFIRKTYNRPEGFIALHEPLFVGNEKKYLEECIDSTFVSSVGKFVDRFEEDLARYTGAKKAIVCVNGTNALHIALLLAGVQRNDELPSRLRLSLRPMPSVMPEHIRYSLMWIKTL